MLHIPTRDESAQDNSRGGPTTSPLESFAIIRKKPPEMKLRDPPTTTKTGENFPAKTREEPSGTLHLERSPSAANRDEAPEVNQDEPLTTTVEQ